MFNFIIKYEDENGEIKTDYVKAESMMEVAEAYEKKGLEPISIRMEGA